jgi:DNA-binding NtrC family response regulator
LNRVIHTAVARATDNVIDPETLLLETSAATQLIDEQPEPSDEAILTLAEVERQHILKVLERFGGNKRRAARALDVSRSTLDRKLRK